MKHYDTIIIGGGLSGCVLGYLLKKQRKNVLIIERLNIKTKNKLCGGLLTEKSYILLCDIFGKELINKLPVIKHDKIIVSNSNQKLEIDSINLRSIERKDLDDFVLDQYLSVGGIIIDNETYKHIDFNNNILTLNKEKYSYDNLVGADGALSQLRKNVSNKRNRICLAYEINEEKNKEEYVNIDFFDKLYGYGWVIPNNKNTVVGIGSVNEVNNLDNEFNNYLDVLNIRNRSKKGAFLPSGKDILLSNKNNVFFVGDAAGLISPVTGEGIYYAMYSSYILSNNMNSKYKQKMNKVINNIKINIFYSKFVYNTRLRKYLFSKYKKNKLFTNAIDKFLKRIL